MPFRFYHIILAIGLIASLPYTSQAEILIDDFVSDTVGGDRIELTGPSSTTVNYTASSAIGGNREVFFEHDYTSSSSLVFLDTPFPTAGLLVSLAVSNPAATDPASDSSWSITYDAAGAGLGVNLSLGGPDILIEWIPDHVAFGNDTVIGLTLTDGNANSHSQSVTWVSPTDTFLNTTNTVFATTFVLNDFASNGVDLTDIDSISFFGETDLAGDYAFSRIAVIPEPSSLLLCGCSGLLLMLRRK